MQIQAKIKTVGVEQPVGKKYQIAEVIYGDEQGETRTKKLMSFANPGVFATLSNAKAGTTYVIDQTKNDKGFWDWNSASLTDETSAANASTAQKAASPTVSKSTYETADERAVRQRLIVRQSSLSNAIEHLGTKATVEQVLTEAEQMVAWVFEAPEIQLTEDIPF